ncbi:MAG: hypothetical protein KKH88_04135, partial [Nanoarchaeota archaeon]|nr:hypothetical protein [Nanoarchaeota archaeon]
MNKTGKRNITISIFVVMIAALIVIGTNASGVLGEEGGGCPEGGLCVCGNGQIETGEECDDGNLVDDCTCLADCTLPYCGDDLMCDSEQCDNGFANIDGQDPVWNFIQGLGDRNYCSTICEVYYVPGTWCGDQVVQMLYEDCETDFDCQVRGTEFVCEGCQCVPDYECEYGAECDDQNSCTDDECVGGFCENDFNDNEGPLTSLLTANKYSEICEIKIEAWETDICSNIETAEYFLGGADCGSEGTGTSMDAFDGNYNALIEQVIADHVDVSDGSLNIHVRGKDIAGNWGECETIRIDIDCIPPDYPRCEQGDLNPGIALDGICNVDEWLVCDDDPLLTANICDDQSRIQLAEYFIDEDNPFNWWGIYMDASDGDYDELCEDVEHTIDMDNLTDGTHYVQLHGKDGQENWGKFEFSPIVSFIKDTTPPVIDKSIDFAGDVFVECDYEVMMDEDITAGCYYVLPGTEIVLDAYDPDPQGTGEFAGEVIIEYIVWWSYDGSVWTEDQSGQSAVDEPILITLNEDSYHLIEFWATDGCGWESEHWFELDIVDSQAPVSSKDLGTPKRECTQDEIAMYGYEDCAYITQSTLVTLTCEDLGPHPVNDVTLHYKIDWKENWENDWTEGQLIPVGSSTEFTYPQDSFHKLTWYCEDALGNIEAEHYELDIVDTLAPIITKNVTGGIYGGENPIHYFLNHDSMITLDCVDQEPHPSDNVNLSWTMEWSLDGEGWQTIDSGSSNGHKEFTGFDSSFHRLTYWCEDALYNLDGPHVELDAVDTDAPYTTKTVGLPSVLVNESCDPNTEICDYWVTTQTQIELDCNDVMPHPIGGETL